MSNRIRTQKVISTVKKLARTKSRITVYDVADEVVQNHTVSDRTEVRERLDQAARGGKIGKSGSRYVSLNDSRNGNLSYITDGLSRHRRRRIRTREAGLLTSPRRKTTKQNAKRSVKKVTNKDIKRFLKSIADKRKQWLKKRNRGRKRPARPTFKHPLKYFQKPEKRPSLKETPKNKIKHVRKRKMFNKRCAKRR